MGLPFPTGRSGQGNIASTGFPLRVPNEKVCHCGDQAMLDQDDICARCGRFPMAVVLATFQARAEKLAMRRTRRAV